VRSGSAPEVLAIVRRALLHRLQGVHPRGFAAALRQFANKPFEAVALLFQSVKYQTALCRWKVRRGRLGVLVCRR
jgi:hypothetical protein